MLCLYICLNKFTSMYKRIANTYAMSALVYCTYIWYCWILLSGWPWSNILKLRLNLNYLLTHSVFSAVFSTFDVLVLLNGPIASSCSVGDLGIYLLLVAIKYVNCIVGSITSITSVLQLLLLEVWYWPR